MLLLLRVTTFVAAGVGAGAATGAATVTATGLSTALAAGSATGSVTATATGLRTVEATGSATGAATVTAESTAPGLSTGSATGAATATATGLCTAVATGSATGSCEVTSGQPLGGTLTIDGVEVEAHIGTIKVTQIANGPDTFECQIDALTGSRPTRGQELIYIEGGARLFGGLIVEVGEAGLTDGYDVMLKLTIRASDFNTLLTRLHVNETLAAGTLKEMLVALADYYTPYSVTLDAAQVDGPDIPELVCEDRRLDDVLNDLTNLSDGYLWNVDAFKVLKMAVPSATPAPFDIVDGTDDYVVGDIEVDPLPSTDNANRVILRIGEGQQLLTNSWIADGSTQEWELTAPYVTGWTVENSPDPDIAHVYETLAVQGTGFDLAVSWLYYSATNTIKRVDSLGPPTSGNTIRIQYQAQYPLRIVRDGGAPADEVIEVVLERRDVIDPILGEAIAEGERVLRQTVSRTVHYKTLTRGLRPGMTQTLVSSHRNLNGTFLITEILVEHWEGDTFVYNVTLVEGTRYLGNWRDDVGSWGGGEGYGSTGTGGTLLSAIGTLSGEGTPDTLSKWLTAHSLGDSAIREAAGNLYLEPSGDVILGPSGADVLPSTAYTVNLGMLSKKYLSLHAAELWVETLVAQNTIATIGGRVLVAPTNILVADVAPGDTTIGVKYNNLSNASGGDVIYLESDGKVEFMRVTGGGGGSPGAYVYNVTRDLDGGGANQWYAGDAVVNTGVTTEGFIDLYSLTGVLSGAGPTIVGNVRIGSDYDEVAPRWAIGNLNGLYAYSSNIYGVAMGDPDATNIVIEATNGFLIRHGTDTLLWATTGGALSLSSDLSIGTAGTIHSNATAYLTGTGYWLAYNAGEPQFHVGNPSGNYFAFNGETGNIAFACANLVINENGVVVAMGPNSRSNDHAYAFSGTGADYLGTYGNSVWTSGAGIELLSILNTGTGSAHNHVRVHAKTGSREAYIFCESSEPDAWSRIWFYSADGAYVFKPPDAASGTTWPTRWVVGSADWWFLKYDSSDERLKQDITPLTRGMATLREIVPIQFTWNESGESDIGFSAQNCLPHIPESTRLMGDGYYAFKTDPIVAVAVTALRELDARLTALEKHHAHD